MPVKIALAYMVERTIGHPVSLVVGDEEFILWTHSNPAGGTKSGGKRLEMSIPIRAVNPTAPGGVVRHVTTSLAEGLTVGHGEFATGTEVERGIFSAEGIAHRTEVVFVVLSGDAKLIGHGFVAIADTIFIGIDQAGEFRFLPNIIYLFLFVPKNTVRFH